MRVVITGGHFSPAYSVIQKIRDKNEILVVGRRYAFEGDLSETYEYKVCTAEDIKFATLSAGRIQRKFTTRTIPSLLRIPKSVIEAYKILKSFNPQVVVSFGGYIGLPTAIAARFIGIPIILHEQTQRAGLSAKLIARMANVVCISFDSSRKYFKNVKVVLTGNPLRSAIFNKSNISFSYSKPLIYITGGSTGSHTINKSVEEILPSLLKKFTVVHQTGNSREYNDYSSLRKLKEELPPSISGNYVVSEFFSQEEVSSFFQNAQLVVSRSGINTVLELMAVGAVSILIPLPYGQHNEQKDNAVLFEKTGLGRMVEQKDLSGENLLTLINDMIKELGEYKKNSLKALQYVHMDAANRIAEQIYFYGERYNKGQHSSPNKESIVI